VHAGDMITLETAEALKNLGKKFIAVSGNMDNEEVKSNYPLKKIFKAGNFKIGLMHGYGPPAGLIGVLQQAFAGEDLDMIIFGHSHKDFNETIGGVLFFNPGSATDRIHCEYNSYGMIEVTDRITARVIKIKSLGRE